MKFIHFLLTPDRSSSRLVRRMVAEKSPRINVIAGTWTELMEQALRAYLLPDFEDTWNKKLVEAAGSVEDAFWTKSLGVAPQESLASIGASLSMLIEGAGPAEKVAPDTKKVLSERARKHLADLAKLQENMDGVLPGRLAAIKAVLDIGKADALSAIVVYHVEGFPRLSPWQKALIDKLGKDFPSTKDKELEGLLSQALVPASAKKRPTALAAIQDNLFDPKAERVKLDDSVQWLAVRDYLEEAEVAAGMVQTIVKEQKLKPSDIGLLIPDDRDYAWAVRDAFAFARLPLSGLNAEQQVRDLGREAVLYYLLCRKTPAPVMALAALFTNPLMPWTREQGRYYASEIMDGKFEFEFPYGASRAVADMLGLVRGGDSDPRTLADKVSRFAGLLADAEGLEDHIENAKEAAETVAAALRAAKSEIPWKEITALAGPAMITDPGIQEISREGITVFTEGEEPWRPVRQMIVAGFGADHYPAKQTRSAVFSETDLATLKDKLGYGIETTADRTSKRRSLFLRQLSAASDGITFLVPKRDAFGKQLQPSGTLAFQSRLFEGIEEPEQLLFDLETGAGRDAARCLALAPTLPAVPPRKLKVDDLSLGKDLLTIRKRRDGTPKPESPSSIETLLVSPLGWFLTRNNLTPSEWEAEQLDPAIKGTLAHKVFEKLFEPGKPLPEPDEIRLRIPGLLNEKVMKHKPMLLAREWRIEYQHLASEIEEAALKWREMLADMKASVVATEVGLHGKLDDLPLYGESDLLLSLPGGRMLVVDYKKSKSKKRRAQMQKGWDSQTSLYRVMLKTGGPADRTRQEVADAVKSAAEIGVMYYLMNDQTSLTDTVNWIGKDVAGVEEMGANISGNAMQAIRDRIAELRAGRIMLNYEDDEKKIETATGLTAKYALDASPLVRLFTKARKVEP